MAKPDDGDLILAKRDYEDARYCLERARDRLRGDKTPLASLLRLLTRTLLQYTHDAIRAIDTIPALPLHDDRKHSTVPPCGGDYASHDVALDAKPGDLAELLDCSEAVDREMSRGWQMRGAHASTDC